MTLDVLTPTKSRRTCAGCGAAIDHASAEKGGSGSVRLVCGPEGEIAVDGRGSAFGRGAHVHTRPDCVAKAAERGLGRSFKAACRVTAASLATEIAAALDRRIEGLLASAARTKAIRLDAVDSSEAFAVLVAVDALSTEVSAVADAVAAGRAVAWGTKQTLGNLTTAEKKPVGVITITSEKIAGTLSDCVRARDAVLAASAVKWSSRSHRGSRSDPGRARGDAAREAQSPSSTNQAERGA